MSLFSGISQNIKAHNSIAESYDLRHGEIFSDTEQDRLHASLAAAARMVRPGNTRPRALDLGCGSGNLTNHLLKLGFQVTASDVSERFLEIVKEKFLPTDRLNTALLNGSDLSGFADGAMDLTAAYSVLHHIPDYLKMVKEMARVTAPGGVLYLDHEHSPAYWRPDARYDAFTAELLKAMPPPPPPPLTRFFKFSTYAEKAKLWLNPRYQAEGDIHVWPDDHVEWKEIERILADEGFDTPQTEDYLLCRRECPPELYARYKDVCSNIRVLTARKAGR